MVVKLTPPALKLPVSCWKKYEEPAAFFLSRRKALSISVLHPFYSRYPDGPLPVCRSQVVPHSLMGPERTDSADGGGWAGISGAYAAGALSNEGQVVAGHQLAFRFGPAASGPSPVDPFRDNLPVWALRFSQ